MPVELMLQRSSGSRRSPKGARVLRGVDDLGVTVYPSLCAFQFLYELDLATG
jgi:hypothetical protein